MLNVIEILKEKQSKDDRKTKIVQPAINHLRDELNVLLMRHGLDVNVDGNQININDENNLIEKIIMLCGKNQKVLVYFDSQIWCWTTQKYRLINTIYDSVLEIVNGYGI